MSKPILPIIKRKTPILDMIREREVLAQKAGVDTLTPAQKRAMEEFRRGIASALGVPPEAIRAEPLEKWITEWTKVWVKEAYWQQGYQLGYDFGQILKEALPPRETGPITGRAGPRRGGTPRTEEERKERHFREISVV